MVASKQSTRTPFFALVPLLLSLGCTNAMATSQVRGELVWSPERQTLTECDTGRIYEIRANASNPYYQLREAVDEASRNLPPDGRLIADLEGMALGAPSSAPAYPVDGTLEVFVTHSVEVGTCD